jgi:hypothetical protein
MLQINPVASVGVVNAEDLLMAVCDNLQSWRWSRLKMGAVAQVDGGGGGGKLNRHCPQLHLFQNKTNTE